MREGRVAALVGILPLFLSVGAVLAQQGDAVSISGTLVVYDRVAVGVCDASTYVRGPAGRSVYVGMTTRKPNGAEYDYAAQEVTLSGGDRQVQFNAIIGLGYTEYVISVWGRKVKPCDTNNPGCRKYGYALADQLATTGWNAIP